MANDLYTPSDIHGIIASSRAIGMHNIALLIPGNLNTQTVNHSDITPKTNLIYKTVTSTEDSQGHGSTRPQHLSTNIYTNMAASLDLINKSNNTFFCFPSLILNTEFLTLVCNTNGEIVVFNTCSNSSVDKYINAAINGAKLALKAAYPRLEPKAKVIKIPLVAPQDSAMISALAATLVDSKQSLARQIPFIEKELKQAADNRKKQQKIRQGQSEAITLYTGSLHIKAQAGTFRNFRLNHPELLPHSIRSSIRPSLAWRLIGFFTAPLRPFYARIDRVFQPSKPLQRQSTLQQQASAMTSPLIVSSVEQEAGSLANPTHPNEVAAYLKHQDPFLAEHFLIQQSGNKILFVPKANVHLSTQYALKQLGQYFNVNSIKTANNQQVYEFHGFKAALKNNPPLSVAQPPQMLPSSNFVSNLPFSYSQPNAPRQSPSYFQTPDYYAQCPNNPPLAPNAPSPQQPYTVSPFK
ncbi:MAG: hypothetical protein HKM04_11205 [Legionellales bacterium]|nr:hypothetical protein [Legionellales bacterium]